MEEPAPQFAEALEGMLAACRAGDLPRARLRAKSICAAGAPAPEVLRAACVNSGVRPEDLFWALRCELVPDMSDNAAMLATLATVAEIMPAALEASPVREFFWMQAGLRAERGESPALLEAVAAVLSRTAQPEKRIRAELCCLLRLMPSYVLYRFAASAGLLPASAGELPEKLVRRAGLDEALAAAIAADYPEISELYCRYVGPNGAEILPAAAEALKIPAATIAGWFARRLRRAEVPLSALLTDPRMAAMSLTNLQDGLKAVIDHGKYCSVRVLALRVLSAGGVPAGIAAKLAGAVYNYLRKPTREPARWLPELAAEELLAFWRATVCLGLDWVFRSVFAELLRCLHLVRAADLAPGFFEKYRAVGFSKSARRTPEPWLTKAIADLLADYGDGDSIAWLEPFRPASGGDSDAAAADAVTLAAFWCAAEPAFLACGSLAATDLRLSRIRDASYSREVFQLGLDHCGEAFVECLAARGALARVPDSPELLSALFAAPWPVIAAVCRCADARKALFEKPPCSYRDYLPLLQHQGFCQEMVEKGTVSPIDLLAAAIDADEPGLVVALGDAGLLAPALATNPELVLDIYALQSDAAWRAVCAAQAAPEFPRAEIAGRAAGLEALARACSALGLADRPSIAWTDSGVRADS